jgi:hypothetical protein
MKKFITLFLSALFLIISCDNVATDEAFEDYATDEALTDRSLSADIGGSTGGSNNGGNGAQPGLITAGEWNDLNNWSFWNNLFNEQAFSKMPDYWSVYTNNRITVLVENNGTPVANAKVELLRNEVVIWTSKTDNLGYATFLVGAFQKEESIDLSSLSLKVNDVTINQSLVLFENGVNKINSNTNSNGLHNVEISFVVDATGSMGDELEFLKADLQSVIENVKNEDTSLNILTSTVFYRDEGDDYVTKKSDFSSNLSQTINFIKEQNAGGGGDFPEAVHSALDVTVNELQWSSTAKTRIAFLLLDAPPHYNTNVTKSIQNTIQTAAAKGIKIIPITASGIDKETEFLMRYMAILTNGTYVFITNDSGIGNEHIEASVGEYQVEKLNDLLVRLIKKYSE